MGRRDRWFHFAQTTISLRRIYLKGCWDKSAGSASFDARARWRTSQITARRAVIYPVKVGVSFMPCVVIYENNVARKTRAVRVSRLLSLRNISQCENRACMRVYVYSS